MLTLLEQKRLQKQFGDEQVSIVPLSCCNKIGFLYTPAAAPLVNSGDFRYVLHYDAEGSRCLQQVVPSIVIRQAGGSHVAVKSTAQNELKALFSTHLHPADANFGNPLVSALLRVADDELGAQGVSRLRFAGHMRTLSGDMAGHLGFCHNAEASFIQQGSWYSQEQLFDEYYRFDLWSKYWIDRLYIKNREEKHAKI